MHENFSFEQILALTSGRPGHVQDVACPECGPHRETVRRRQRKVLRIWRYTNSAGYVCQRCGIKGFCFNSSAPRMDISGQQAEFEAYNKEYKDKRRAAAHKLLQLMQPARDTLVETYLRKARAYGGPIPPTLGFLPAWKDIPPRMVGLFGIPDEEEPGKLRLPIARVPGIHITRLKPDGSGRESGEYAKTMMASSKGHPLVLAPVNDNLGLLICEGIETGLSWYEATGLGVWVAGSANRMPALADAVPNYVDCVRIDQEGDFAGLSGASDLSERLRKRGIHTEIVSTHSRNEKVA